MARKNVSLLVSAAGWIGSFVGELIPALRERGIQDDQIHALVTGNGLLLGKIADAIVEAVKQVKNLYTVCVDYTMRIDDLVVEGNYDWSNGDITSDHFPSSRTSKADVEIELIHLNRIISSDEAVKELDRVGLRPAKAHELLAFGAKYPEIQREFPIVALGSVWRDSDDDRRVVFLGRDGAERDANLNWFENDWNDNCRFAAVRNSLYFSPPRAVFLS